MGNKRVLSIDYGTKRIGIATGSFEGRVAFPRDVILNKGVDFVLKEVFSVCKKLEIDMIIVGMPFNMKDDQSNSRMISEVNEFVKSLKIAISESADDEIKKINVDVFDERLSSFEADALMKSAQKSEKERGKYRDVYAAQIILQRFFDTK